LTFIKDKACTAGYLNAYLASMKVTNMADETLEGLKVAILVTDGFEEVELTEPRKALEQAGADTSVVSPKGHEVRGWNFTDWGQKLPVDLKLEDARLEDFDALLLPGGVINPDKLRIIPAAVAFVNAFFDAASQWRRFVMVPGQLSKRTRRGDGA
jgi:putative intracellular protease/amidase